jgi:carbon-monoxide dehydrogenase large subunit
MAGSAVGTACEALVQRLIHIGAHLLDEPTDTVEVALGAVWTKDRLKRVPLEDIAWAWYRAPQTLPADVDPGGLSLTTGYRMQPDTGTFSYACHVCAVQVDTTTGFTKLLDYVVCEDGGTLLNPLVVEGQLLGGLAQGIGTALLEEMPFDETGQPLATTLADYMLPGAGEMPSVRIEHMQTPSPFSKYGQKGIGEGGAIAPPAAVVNAINDALAALGAEVLTIPASPERIRQSVAQANSATRSAA